LDNRSHSVEVPLKAGGMKNDKVTGKRLAVRYGGAFEDKGYSRILSALSFFSGSTPVFIFLPSEKRSIALPSEYSVDLSDGVMDALSGMCGKDNVTMF